MQYVLFTDNLADLSLAEAARQAKAAGFDGLDLTLRPGGHVLPENAEMGLAEAQRIAADAGIVIPMASTAITDIDSPHAEQIFASAAHYGVRRLKLGYWSYEPFGTAAKQYDAVRGKLERLVRLGEKYRVLPCVHCHSGRLMACGGFGTWLIVKDFPPTAVGAYVDPMHMVSEGGSAGWELGLDLLAAHVGLVGIKNSKWVPTDRDAAGQQRFRQMYTPLADGHAPMPEFMRYLRQLKYDGIVSLHSEYKGGSSFRQLSTPELLAQSAADLKYLKSLNS